MIRLAESVVERLLAKPKAQMNDQTGLRLVPMSVNAEGIALRWRRRSGIIEGEWYKCSPEADVSKLDGLNAQVRSCRLCRLCRTRMNGVPGDGNEAAAVLFIGEGPGYNEDRDGKPFVGQAGQFLDELLGIAGLQRREVYITNVVKCRPPQNRDPLPDEIDACSGYLERQIAAIDPLLIVTLGRHSMARFFPDAKITSIHGQAKPIEGRMVLPMLHPAYGLRDDRGRESLKEDFRRLPTVLAEAQELRAARPGPAPRQASRLQAVVEAHLDTLTQVHAQADAPAVPPVEAGDPFAYVAAVTDPARRGGRRKVAAVTATETATVAVPVPTTETAVAEVVDAPVAAEAVAILDAPEDAVAPDAPIMVTIAVPARASGPTAALVEQGVVEPLLIVPVDPSLSDVAPLLMEATSPAEKPRRGRPAKAAAPVAETTDATPAEAATPAGKKGKPDPDFEQLSLFG